MPDSTTTALTPMQQAVIALKAQRARIAELEQGGSAPIAVVGMACRYPADSVSPAALWEALRDGRDGSREVPPDRWDVDAFYDPIPGAPGKMYVRKSCFIAEVDRFEPLFFRISPREAIGIDPQQRLLLEVTWEALEDAAIAPPSLVGSDTGVFIGISTNDYSALLSRTVHGSGSNATAGAGNAASIASGRLSYTFGFQGPCMAIDTACSSSLVATHLAVQALRNRECGLAVVAGVNLMLTPDITVNFCQGRMLSSDGACKSFDASADGYVRGEGCGALILKRLADAQADGDRILAVVRGSAVGQDGRSAGLTAPNGIAQEAVIGRALANAGLGPDDIDYIEAHGTGTALGDPIEMHALKAVFAGRERPLYVGSVKTNIGHAEAAAGVAGLIKAVLMLQHQAVPPNLHFRRLNPHIDLSGLDIRVPTALTPAPLSAIGVSSFGFSGTNVHVVLGAASAAPARLVPGAAPGAERPVLFLSARTREALIALIDRYRSHLATTADAFGDICHTAAIGRARLPWWVAVGDPAGLATAEPVNTPPPPLHATNGRKVALPGTAFQRERCWIDGTLESAPEPPVDSGLHPLLGHALALPFSSETRWEAAIFSDHPALDFLAGHRVNGVPVLPAAAFIEIALAAFPDAALAGFELVAPLRVPTKAERRVQTIADADGGFRIVSYLADAAKPEPVTHAIGRIVPRMGPGALPRQIAGVPLETEAVYAAMARRGISHGPAFRLIDGITRGDGFASATLRGAAGERRFAVHPARLDAAFQLVAAALPAASEEQLLPAEIAAVSLYRAPAAEARVYVTARHDESGVLAEIVVADAEGVALEVRGLRFRPAASREAASGFYRLEWRHQSLTRNLAPPGFLPPPEEIAATLATESSRLAAAHGVAVYARSARGLEDAATLYIVKALRALGLQFRAGAEFTFGAMAEVLGVGERHHRLLRRLFGMLAEDGVLAGNLRRWRVLSAPSEADPEAAIDALLAEAPALAGEIAVLRRCGAALAELLAGKVEPLSLLFPGDRVDGGVGASAFYETSPYARTVNGLLAAAAGRLAAALPRGRVLRILEVGAGTGGATGAVLSAVPRDDRHYVFTDVSAGFFAAASRKFGGEALEMRLLDLEISPQEQGFATASFDLVLAVNVLHATRDLRDSLGNIAALLAPGGMLLLVESTERRRWVDIVFGLTEGWWRFADSGLRPDHPLLSGDAWRDLLGKCGFRVAGDDCGEVIVARRARAAAPSGEFWHVAGDVALSEALAAAGQSLAPAAEAGNRVEVLPPTPPDEAAQIALLGRLIDCVRGALSAPRKPRLTIVADATLGHSSVAGFVRTLAVEAPELRARLLIAPPGVTALVDELVAGEEEAEIGWDDTGRRRVRRLVTAPAASGAGDLSGTWLITGARGGVGRAIAGWLAGHGATGLVLLSRQKPTAPFDVAVPVHAYGGDAADAELIARLVADHQIIGIVHAAGVLADAPIEAQTPETIGAVLHAKIGGALAIDAAARAHPVRHFVLCASAAGVLGSARQVNHAFASAWLDGLAAQRRAEGLPALSLDWGVWSGIGSAAALGFDAQADRLGLGSLSPEQGTALFGAGLGAVEPQLVVLPSVDWRRFTAHFGNSAPALFAELTAGAGREPAPAPARAPPEPATDRAAQLGLIVRQSLGITGAVDPETPLHDLGLDSLVAVEIRNRVERELGLAVSVRELIEGASLRSLLEVQPQPAAAAAPEARRQIVPDPDNRFVPFPLTDMQRAYWLGRRDDLTLGSVSCYLYTEFDTQEVDLARAEAAWNQLIRRHEMLRVVIRPDGTQQILPEVPEYRFERIDLRGGDAGPELERLRQNLAQRVTEPDSWPLFDIRVTLYEDRARLHMGFDLIALDAASIHGLRREWGALYDDPAAALPLIGLSFRDVVIEEIGFRASPAWRRHEEYWQGRALTLPAAPELPVTGDLLRPARRRFRRRQVTIDAAGAAALRHQVQRRGMTLPAVMAAAYADILAAWSRTSRFAITVTSFSRPDLHPDIGSLLGDFTSTILLEIDAGAPRFADRAVALSRRLAEDLEHAEFGGVQVLREIARQGAGAAVAVPVVFTSALGFRRGAEARAAAATEAGGWDRLGSTVYSVSSTPQVLIDHQISEEDGALFCNWDAAEDMFAPGVLDRMVVSYEALLAALAADSGWDRPIGAAPPEESRAPFTPVPAAELLHAAFERQAKETPRRIALIAPDREIDYRTLNATAAHLAEKLLSRLGGAPRDRLVAVGYAKGWQQIVAVLAVLKAGAAYLPLDPALPAARRRSLIERSGAIVLEDDSELDVALALAQSGAGTPAVPLLDDPARLAYVIFTSGSTGEPKGVMIEHRSAVATVGEVNRRWQVGAEDRVLGLSSLSFDLSVYDMFGPLSVGGALVLPPMKAGRDPSVWAQLLLRHQVTIWNSVPALMAMLAEYGLPCDHRLRLVLMSGDWVPVELAARLSREMPATRLVALGGATEAAIWSNAHEIDALAPDWPSIPYGTPLAGHGLHVVNDRGQPCPDWVIGEIEISGEGLARGYLGDPGQTAERFRTDPASGERRYRTGDLGRFRPYAAAPAGLATPIEFLGREDSQVKVQGYRIELGEVEAALTSHPEVAEAIAAAPPAAGSRDRTLRAFVVTRSGAERPRGEEDADWQRLVESAEATAAREARPVTRDAFEETAATFNDQAAAAAAAAIRHLTGSYELPDEEALIGDHGVAPRYRHWLARMLPEVARIGMAAEPQSSHAISGVDRLGFGPAALDFLDHVIEHLPAIITEREHSSAIYLADETPDIYARLFAAQNAVVGAALRAIVGNRDAAILEVGGGLGTTLAAIEPMLPTERLSYLFTDVSPHLLRAARAKFSGRAWVSFGTLDLDEPAPQHAGRFDAIVAASALHAAPDIVRALSHVRSWLAPGGFLVVLEQTRFFPWFDLGMGLQLGFDSRRDLPLRPRHPLLSRDSWRRLLGEAGFGPVAVPISAGSIDDRLGFDVILARAGGAPTAADSGLSDRLSAHLRERLPGYMVPATIDVVDRIPLSANGKVDRSALVSAARQSASAGGASDRLRREVAEAVAGLMQLDAVDPQRSLFELGANSLTLVSVQRLLGERFGRKVPLQRIFEHPTVAGFAAELAGGGAASSGLIRFDAAPPGDDTRPNLVMMPGIFSLPFYLRDLAKAVAGDLALVSVQLPGLADGEVPIDTVNGQAEYVVAELRRGEIRPPYLLGGHSFGGLVAIEVARRLREAGEAVALLVLGDTVRTTSAFSALQSDELAYTAMTRGLDALYGRQTGLPCEAADGTSAAEKFERTAGHMQEQGSFGALALPLDRMVAIFKANFRAIGGYRPSPIQGDVALIRTEGGFPAELLEYESGEAIDDPGLGWSALVRGQLDIHTMQGDHLSMLDKSSLPAIARILSDLVRDALAGHRKTPR